MLGVATAILCSAPLTSVNASTKINEIHLSDIQYDEYSFKNYQSLTSEQKKLYNEALKAEMMKYQDQDDFNEQIFKEVVDSIVFEDNAAKFSNMINNQSKLRWKYTGIWIDNKIVASGINVAISLATGGVGTVGIRMLVKKVGTKAAIQVVEKTVRNKLILFGIKQFSGISYVISTIVKNVLDPGTTIAKWLDAHDKRPNNGRCDII